MNSKIVNGKFMKFGEAGQRTTTYLENGAVTYQPPVGNGSCQSHPDFARAFTLKLQNMDPANNPILSHFAAHQIKF